jgi:hypothetical protein
LHFYVAVNNISINNDYNILLYGKFSFEINDQDKIKVFTEFFQMYLILSAESNYRRHLNRWHNININENIKQKLLVSSNLPEDFFSSACLS